MVQLFFFAGVFFYGSTFSPQSSNKLLVSTTTTHTLHTNPSNIKKREREKDDVRPAGGAEERQSVFVLSIEIRASGEERRMAENWWQGILYYSRGPRSRRDQVFASCHLQLPRAI